MPYVVQINLALVARRLSKSTTHFHDDFDALHHLTAPRKTEPSPFKQTMDLDVFYTDQEPGLLLEEAEIAKQQYVPVNKKPHLISGVFGE